MQINSKLIKHFGFNDPKFGNNSAIIRYLNTLRPIKGTTSAHLALSAAFRLFSDPLQNGSRKKGSSEDRRDSTFNSYFPFEYIFVLGFGRFLRPPPANF